MPVCNLTPACQGVPYPLQKFITGSPTWSKVLNKHCNQKHLTQYSTLDNAEQQCTAMGSVCAGVYDGSCDNKDFYLCKDDSEDLNDSEPGSCVYTPPGEAVPELACCYWLFLLSWLASCVPVMTDGYHCFNHLFLLLATQLIHTERTSRPAAL